MSLSILDINKAIEIPCFKYPEKLNGNTFWFTKNKPYKVHRPEKDGPAIEWANGDTSYYLIGKIHRLGGHALVRMNGNNLYHIFGSDPLTEEQYLKTLKKLKGVLND